MRTPSEEVQWQRLAARGLIQEPSEVWVVPEKPEPCDQGLLLPILTRTTSVVHVRLVSLVRCLAAIQAFLLRLFSRRTVERVQRNTGLRCWCRRRRRTCRQPLGIQEQRTHNK